VTKRSPESTSLAAKSSCPRPTRSAARSSGLGDQSCDPQPTATRLQLPRHDGSTRRRIPVPITDRIIPLPQAAVGAFGSTRGSAYKRRGRQSVLRFRCCQGSPRGAPKTWQAAASRRTAAAKSSNPRCPKPTFRFMLKTVNHPTFLAGEGDDAIDRPRRRSVSILPDAVTGSTKMLSVPPPRPSSTATLSLPTPAGDREASPRRPTTLNSRERPRGTATFFAKPQGIEVDEMDFHAQKGDY